VTSRMFTTARTVLVPVGRDPSEPEFSDLNLD
jgi:hypothetical protein